MTTEAQQALQLIASRRLASASALQRWMGVSFRRATELLDELQAQGHVGPADGSKARTVYAQYCQQCGRIGRRAFTTYPSGDFGGPPLTVCTTKSACRRRRRPAPAIEEAP